MANNNMPLRYNISDWRQLNQCLSNNSRDLKIEVSNIMDNNVLEGLRISVVHAKYGSLFTYVLHSRGSLVSRDDFDDSNELTPAQILKQLKRYGFLVSYNPVKNLSGTQLDYLATLSHLGYDKIRLLPVKKTDRGETTVRTVLIVFNADKNTKWLDNTYMATELELSKSLLRGDGSCVILNHTAYDFDLLDWQWLRGFVGSIDDILRDNLKVSY